MSPAAPQSTSTGARKRAANGRLRLLEAAAAEFCDSGYAGASIAAIARRAGISKSTIFHHFESKEALYLAVITGAAAEFGETLANVLAPGTKPDEALPAFQRTHLDHIHRNEQVARLVLRELQGAAASERTLSQVSEALSANYKQLLVYLQRARSDGAVRIDADCEVAALLLFAANVFFFQNREILSRLPGLDLAGDPGRYADAVADLVLRGLSAHAVE